MQPLEYGFEGSRRYAKYYRHSGRVNVKSLVAPVVVGLALGLPMAVAYAAVLTFVPFMIVRILGCVGFAFMLGTGPATMLFRRKVRNTAVALATVGLIAVVAYYVAWASWEWMLLQRAPVSPSPWALLVRPDRVVRIAARVYQVGTWSLGHGPFAPPASPSVLPTVGPFAQPQITYGGRTGDEAVSGLSLGAFWLVEAAAIIGVPLALTRTMVRGTPFCEACDRWCAGPTVIRQTAWADPAEVRRKLEAGEFAEVAMLGPANPAKHLEFSSYRCARCGNLHTLSAVTRTVRKDRKGARHAREQAVVRHLLVTAGELQQLAAPPAAEPGVYAVTVPGGR